MSVTSPLATMELVVGSVWFHRVFRLENGNPFRRDLNGAWPSASCVFLGTNIQINKGLHALDAPSEDKWIPHHARHREAFYLPCPR